MALVPKGFPTGTAIEVLRQQHRAYSLAKRRELGDSLVAYATRQTSSADDAILVIAMAGSARPGLPGVSDPEALDQLLRVYRQAVSSATRYAALVPLLDQIDPARAFARLREIAISSDDNGALTAVTELERFAFGSGSPGSAADRESAGALLKELFEQDLVKTGPALHALCGIASNRKWSAKGRCRGMA
jgi:hypothetical protein